MSRNKIQGSRGFTLIELMLATVVASIVMSAAGALMVGFWHTSVQFISEEQTMQEISHLSRLFAMNSHLLPSSLSADLVLEGVLFPGDKTVSILYHPDKNEITYDLDADSLGGESTMLSKSIVDNVFAVISTGGVVRLDVKIRENELNLVNKYRMYAAPRNE